MPKKKQEDPILTDEITGTQEQAENQAADSGDAGSAPMPEDGGFEEPSGDAAAETDPGGASLLPNEQPDTPAEPAPGAHSNDSTPEETPGGNEPYPEVSMPSGDPDGGGSMEERPQAYGGLGDQDEDDLFGEGEGPPQFDLSDLPATFSMTGQQEPVLMLDPPPSLPSAGPEDGTANGAEEPLEEEGESGDAPAVPTVSPRRGREPAPADAAPETPAPQAAAPARRRASSGASGVLSIDEDLKVQSVEDKDALLWMELRSSLRSKRILTGILGGVERTPNGGCIAVVYYKDRRVVIPGDEMFTDIGIHQTDSERDLQNRYAQILTRALNSEVDFIISGIDRRGNSVVASRKEALIRKQLNFYYPTARRREPLLSEGMIVEARVVSVGTKNIRIEAFGVESTIWARYVAWEWVEDCSEFYQVGDRVLVKVVSIDRSNPEMLRIEASVRDCVPNPALENIDKCQAQGKYIGKVTGMDTRAIYVRLNVGVNGIAIACHDRKVPGRKDDVSFVIIRIDRDQGIAIGIITKIIKQHF